MKERVGALSVIIILSLIHICIDPVTGRAIQKSVSAKTHAECKEKLAKAIRENRGVPLNHTGDYTAAEWCRLWFETYSKPNIRYNTAKGYEGIIEHHIIPAIGAIKLRQLSSIHIQRMYNETKENGRMQRGSKQNGKALSHTFVRRVHAVLQAADVYKRQRTSMSAQRF